MVILGGDDSVLPYAVRRSLFTDYLFLQYFPAGTLKHTYTFKCYSTAFPYQDLAAEESLELSDLLSVIRNKFCKISALTSLT